MVPTPPLSMDDVGKRERKRRDGRKGGTHTTQPASRYVCVHWQASLLASWANGATAVSHPMTQAQLALLWAKLDTVERTGRHFVSGMHAQCLPVS